jgi:hypothetical protein
MLIDFTNFSTLTKGSPQISDFKGINNSSWEFAAAVAVAWKSLIYSTLAVPVGAFKLAISEVPVYLAEKTWQWSYNAVVSGVTYKARIVGEIGATEVTWKMYITKEGTDGFADFLWIEGSSKLDGTGGQWLINQSALAPVKLLQIDWTKSGSTVGKVKYTYLKSDSFNTSYIEYGLTTSTLNGYYTVHYYNGVKFSDINIEWNTSSLDGRVKSSDYLEGVWYCWDSGHLNKICP